MKKTGFVSIPKSNSYDLFGKCCRVIWIDFFNNQKSDWIAKSVLNKNQHKIKMCNMVTKRGLWCEKQTHSKILFTSKKATMLSVSVIEIIYGSSAGLRKTTFSEPNTCRNLMQNDDYDFTKLVLSLYLNMRSTL
jgi:hypothetical protein